MTKTTIFHVDVNNAFLSFEADYQLKVLKTDFDLRLCPSIIGGNRENRHGIVLAKSPLAKEYGIVTGEPIANALKKCPNLIICEPHHKIYVEYSNRLMACFREYAPIVEQVSIDEAFLDMSGTETIYGDLIEFAHKLKDTIYEQHGFTVNVGISTNKLLAKMASDFKKPNMVHTLFPDEIQTKMWPLPVSSLFFAGNAASSKLHTLGIDTIGQLAQSDKSIIEQNFGRHGILLHDYANGIGDSHVTDKKAQNKGYGNEMTLATDVTDMERAKGIILSLSETVGARVRHDNSYISVISVSYTTNTFITKRKQITLKSPTNESQKIYATAATLFEQLWDLTPLRLIGVHTGKASNESYEQIDLFDYEKSKKNQKLNTALDQIREKYGEQSIKLACFIEPKS